ncbi:P27 family phage terminase small subunit [Vibrio breoganii]|uniref:P27 family phage terminase small subunit n=1 Tax=Vibrio breoganii TaxID=553239 RepID=UPI00105679A5|nr:P27 family phage terminase small subunit [Vibrio breoganii]
MAKSALEKTSEAEKARKPVKVPSGVKFTLQEKKLWKALTSQRLEWDDSELVQLVRIVNLDTESKKAQQQVDEQGLTIYSSQGTMIAHPLIKVKAQNIALINQILRMLGMYNKDTRALNTATKEANKTNENEDGLLA